MDLGIWGRGFWRRGETDTCRLVFREDGVSFRLGIQCGAGLG